MVDVKVLLTLSLAMEVSFRSQSSLAIVVLLSLSDAVFLVNYFFVVLFDF